MASVTAKQVYKSILDMPVTEREKLFSIIARHGFDKDTYTHDEVFSDLKREPFTIREAAEYFEVAEITVRRWVNEGILKHDRIGRSIVFDPEVLRVFKRQRQGSIT